MFLAADSFFDSSTWSVAQNLALFLGLVFWAATVYWVYKDARRRIEDPWLVAMATLLGAIPPFLGPLIYMLFRPPEYLEDVRERELEILAIEEQLAERDLGAPSAGAPSIRRSSFARSARPGSSRPVRHAARRSSRSGRCALTAPQRCPRASLRGGGPPAASPPPLSPRRLVSRRWRSRPRSCS